MGDYLIYFRTAATSQNLTLDFFQVTLWNTVHLIFYVKTYFAYEDFCIRLQTGRN